MTKWPWRTRWWGRTRQSHQRALLPASALCVHLKWWTALAPRSKKVNTIIWCSYRKIFLSCEKNIYLWHYLQDLAFLWTLRQILRAMACSRQTTSTPQCYNTDQTVTMGSIRQFIRYEFSTLRKLFFYLLNICTASISYNVLYCAYQAPHLRPQWHVCDFSKTDFHDVTSENFITTLPPSLMLFFSSGNFYGRFSAIDELTVKKKSAEKPLSNAISVWEELENTVWFIPEEWTMTKMLWYDLNLICAQSIFCIFPGN